LPTGDYYLIVQTDALGNQPESDEQNNVAASTTPLSLTFPPLPDLIVGNITVDEAAANNLLSGGPMTIRWETVNEGAAGVNTTFHERIVITNGGQELFGEVVVYDASDAREIGLGSAVPRMYVFTLPDGDLGAGTLDISITTDFYDEIGEGLSGTLPETNNTTSAAFATALRPYPDLVVNSLSVDPAAVQTGRAVTVSWQTVNVGTEPVSSSFSEQVKIVSQADGDVLSEQTIVYDAAANGPIGANQSRDRSLTVMVPDGSSNVGSWSVTVTTDYAEDSAPGIFEYNASGTGETNNSAIAPLSVLLAPYPDLVTSEVSGPSGRIIADPAHITVGWKVTNSGNREAQAAGWFDVVYASPDTTFGDANDVEVGRFERTTALAAGAFYIRSEEIVLPPPPDLKSGRYHLFVQADATDSVFEDKGEGNNVARTLDFFDVMPIPYADLVVSAVNVPGPLVQAGR
jgi:hypothetical protein